MYDELAGLLMTIVPLLLILSVCIKFLAQQATAAAVAVNDKPNRSRSSKATAVPHPESGPSGDHHQMGRTDLIIPSSPDWPGGWGRTRELKMTCGACLVGIAGAERKSFVEMFFSLKCNRSSMHTRVQLSLDQVDFGIINSCTRNCSARNQQCDRSCKTVLIYKMTIEVRPKSWAQECRRLLLHPHDTAEVFDLQQFSNASFQMPLVCPKKASITYQTGNTISHPASTFGWSPAQKDAASNAVSWTWEQKRYANGKKLEFKRFRWASRPILGMRPGHMHLHPESFKAEASWELQPNAKLWLQDQQLECDVQVTLHTAVVQSKQLGYSITVGPTQCFAKLLAFSK